MATGSFQRPRLFRATHPASQAWLSNVPNSLSYRVFEAQNPAEPAFPGHSQTHPTSSPPPNPPKLCGAIPASSSYPPPFRLPPPAAAAMVTDNHLPCALYVPPFPLPPSVFVSCQGDWQELLDVWSMADPLHAALSTFPSPMRALHPSPCAPSKLTRNCPPRSHGTLRPCPAPARNKIQWSVSNTRPRPTGCFESPSTPS